MDKKLTGLSMSIVLQVIARLINPNCSYFWTFFLHTIHGGVSHLGGLRGAPLRGGGGWKNWLVQEFSLTGKWCRHNFFRTVYAFFFSHSCCMVFFT